MILANKNGERVSTFPGLICTCPLCESSVISKCGEINKWHFAHKNLTECDNWSEPETDWHRDWKSNFPIQNQEVIVQQDGKKHFADVKINGLVIEFQNSNISHYDIKQREQFYGNMNWIINGATLAKNITIFDKGSYVKFRWKWFPKNWSYSNKKVFIDLDFIYQCYNKQYQQIKDKDDLDEYSENFSYTAYEEYADGESYPYKAYSTHQKKYGQRKQELLIQMNFYKDKLLDIKKIGNTGSGWGKIITTNDFLYLTKSESGRKLL